MLILKSEAFLTSCIASCTAVCGAFLIWAPVGIPLCTVNCVGSMGIVSPNPAITVPLCTTPGLP